MKFEPADSGQVRIETVDLYKKDVPTYISYSPITQTKEDIMIHVGIDVHSRK